MTRHLWAGVVASLADLATASPDKGRIFRAQAVLTKAALSALVCLPLLGSMAWAQSTQFRLEDVRAALLESNRASAIRQQDGLDDPVTVLSDFAKALPDPVETPRSHGNDLVGTASHDRVYMSLLDYVQQLDPSTPKPIATDQPHGRAEVTQEDAVSTLVEFAQQLESQAPEMKLAEVKKSKPVKSVVKATPDVEATFVGSQVCMTCHATHAVAFAQTVMGRLFRKTQDKGSCETCHGPGSLHVKVGGGRNAGGIISFRKEDTSRTVAENNAICLGCHDKGDRNYWQGSTHESRDVACTNCHQVMTKVSLKAQLKKETELETCFQCHKDRRMQAQRSSHMPLREGKMVCTNCHNPHGSANEAMLRQATVNDNCYQCHAEKRGPFLWEHPPVRENCLNCHEAHGSNNENLLKVARPRLCQDCHSAGHASQSPLVNTAFNRSCNNCHSQIHGSNHPSGGLFQR